MKKNRISAVLACLVLMLSVAPLATAGPSPSVGNCYCDCNWNYWCYAAGCGGWQLCQDFTNNHCWWDQAVQSQMTHDELHEFLDSLANENEDEEGPGGIEAEDRTTG